VHEMPEVRLRGLDYQVNVIGHQAKGVNPNIELIGGFSEPLQESPPIPIIPK